MADKSPRQTSSKKSGKTLKEKRAEKKAKQDGKDGGITVPHRWPDRPEPPVPRRVAASGPRVDP